ncbi:hypothetical protein BDR03DRAFT_987394 [Suillus americanus]|nr:hypothetical protein BDR03DRAFT_987394 [Suillus americanus]
MFSDVAPSSAVPKYLLRWTEINYHHAHNIVALLTAHLITYLTSWNSSAQSPDESNCKYPLVEKFAHITYGRLSSYTHNSRGKAAGCMTKTQKYYHSHKDTINTKRCLSYTLTKHKQSSIPQKSKMSGMDTPLTSSARKSLSPALTTLSGCLELIKNTKDELVGLAILPGPYAYVEHILGRYVATVPHECFDIETVDCEEPGDISIIDDAICMVRKSTGMPIMVKTQFSTCAGRGTTELAIVHVHQTLKYQSDRLDDM